MKVLVIAPHADDETLGCGATIAKLADAGNDIAVAVLTGPGPDEHPDVPQSLFDKVRAEFAKAMRILGVAQTWFGEIPTTYAADMPRRRLNAEVKRAIDAFDPELLFVPFALDLHSDHREIFHAASITWRPYLESGRRIREVLCYEVPTETHLNFPYVEQSFVPNVWYDVSATIEQKIEAFAAFESQAQPAPLPRSPEALRALALWRGSQIGVTAAEAFVAVRLLR
jgi:LmbE family N-acetylglucosaminyl deacetylase